MSDVDLTWFPQSPKQEFAAAAARFLASFLPVGGGAAVELLSALMPEITKRRIVWFEYVGTALKQVQEQLAATEPLEPATLFQRPEFTSMFLHATEIAMRSHQREKLEALRNAVLQAALPNALDEDLQLVYLSYVDTMTPWHLRLLRFLDKPMEGMRVRHVSPPPNPHLTGIELIECTFPDLKGHQSYYDVFINELYARRLIADYWMERLGYQHPDVRGASRTSEQGKQFLAFITSPIPDLGDTADSNGDSNVERQQAIAYDRQA